MESDLDIVIDTSALISVIVEEPERTKIIELTTGNTLIAPGSIPWEIPNKYAYDTTYLLDCAIRYKSPLLTLDRKLITAAKKTKVDALEV
jgi:predicted nucleic acid-binding protein